MEESIESYRKEFPITERFVFLNHAGVSSPSLRVVRAVELFYDEYLRCGVSCYSGWMRQVKETRRLVADLIQAEPHEIAFVGNTSDGLSAVAEGLSWKAGEGVLVPRPDFPSNIYPWMNLERRGVAVRFYDRRSDGRFGPEDIEKALHPGVRLLAVSSVDFSTGFHADLEALGDLCRRKGLLFCVDAIQSLGVLPMDVKRCGIHFMATGGHKWLMSTMGIGALYVASEVLPLLHPVRVGWKSVIDELDFFRIHFDLKPDALKLESGTLNFAGIVALGAAVRLLLEAGVERVRQRVLHLVDLLHEGLGKRSVEVITPMGHRERSGIRSFRPRSDPAALLDFLSANHVMAALRGDRIRISPHFYNNDEDVDRFFEALDRGDRG